MAGTMDTFIGYSTWERAKNDIYTDKQLGTLTPTNFYNFSNHLEALAFFSYGNLQVYNFGVYAWLPWLADYLSASFKLPISTLMK